MVKTESRASKGAQGMKNDVIVKTAICLISVGVGAKISNDIVSPGFPFSIPVQLGGGILGLLAGLAISEAVLEEAELEERGDDHE